jgi:ubiquitin conjugation factor E4 B
MAKAQLEQTKRKVDLYLGIIFSYEVQLLDPAFIEKLHYFCSFSMAWLLRVVDPKGQHPQKPIELPLPEEVPERFAMLPEYLVEDIVTFYENVSKFCPPDLLSRLPLDQLLNFIVVFLSTPLVKNPYLVRESLLAYTVDWLTAAQKGKMVDVLYYNTRPTRANKYGALGDAINVHPLALQHLVSALIRIYIDIETTGTHTQCMSVAASSSTSTDTGCSLRQMRVVLQACASRVS